MPCIKYNYSLSEITQNFSSYVGFLKVSDDEQKLKIYVGKPIQTKSSDEVDSFLDELDALNQRKIKNASSVSISRPKFHKRVMSASSSQFNFEHLPTWDPNSEEQMTQEQLEL